MRFAAPTQIKVLQMGSVRAQVYPQDPPIYGVPKQILWR
jgi:hypothetical protein